MEKRQTALSGGMLLSGEGCPRPATGGREGKLGKTLSHSIVFVREKDRITDQLVGRAGASSGARYLLIAYFVVRSRRRRDIEKCKVSLAREKNNPTRNAYHIGSNFGGQPEPFRKGKKVSSSKKGGGAEGGKDPRFKMGDCCSFRHSSYDWADTDRENGGFASHSRAEG